MLIKPSWPLQHSQGTVNYWEGMPDEQEQGDKDPKLKAIYLKIKT